MWDSESTVNNKQKHGRGEGNEKIDKSMKSNRQKRTNDTSNQSPEPLVEVVPATI